MTAGLASPSIGCRVCDAELHLDDSTITRSAEIATFVSAHRHSRGLTITLTMPFATDNVTGPS
jgi:hypothetical protein